MKCSSNKTRLVCHIESCEFKQVLKVCDLIEHNSNLQKNFNYELSKLELEDAFLYIIGKENSNLIHSRKSTQVTFMQSFNQFEMVRIKQSKCSAFKANVKRILLRRYLLYYSEKSKHLFLILGSLGMGILVILIEDLFRLSIFSDRTEDENRKNIGRILVDGHLWIDLVFCVNFACILTLEYKKSRLSNLRLAEFY